MTFAEHALEEALRVLIRANSTISPQLETIPADFDQDQEAENGNPFNVYIGIDDSGVNYSCVTVSAGSAEAIVGPNMQVGCFMVRFSVKVFTKFSVEYGTDTGRILHKQNCAAIWDVLRSSTLADDLRTAGVLVQGATGQDVLRLAGRTSTNSNGCRSMEFQCELPILDNP